jgi:hypothetical protein
LWLVVIFFGAGSVVPSPAFTFVLIFKPRAGVWLRRISISPVFTFFLFFILVVFLSDVDVERSDHTPSVRSRPSSPFTYTGEKESGNC